MLEQISAISFIKKFTNLYTSNGKYSDAMLEAACKKALSYTASPSYKSIKNILVTGSYKLASETTDTKTTQKAHCITRGADYYRR